MPYDYSPYTLPTIDFVGGSTQDLIFHSFFYSNKRPFDLSDCSANFSIINFVNKNGMPILSKSMQIASGDLDNGRKVPNLLKVTLLPSETYGLHGKFIYQISVKKSATQVDIPNHGIIYITNNINKGYITS